MVLATEHVLTRSWCLIEIFEAVRQGKPVIFMSVEGKGFELQPARVALGSLEETLADVNPATLDDLAEYFASEQSVERNGPVSLGMLANTVLSVLPSGDSQMQRLNLHHTDNRIAAEVTDLVEAMAEQTGRTLQWKNRVTLTRIQLQSSSRLQLQSSASSHSPSRQGSRRPTLSGRRLSLSALSGRQGHDPQDQQQGGKWFLCHHRAEAMVHARSMQTWIGQLLRQPCFLNGASDQRGRGGGGERGGGGDGGGGGEGGGEGDGGGSGEGGGVLSAERLLLSALEEAKAARALLLVLTRGCMLRPWVLLECFVACIHSIPIVPVQVVGGGYDFGRARHTLANLRTALDEGNPGAAEAIDEALKPMGYTFDDLAHRLSTTIPHLISLPYSQSDSANQMTALVQDIVERVIKAQLTVQRNEAAARAAGTATAAKQQDERGGSFAFKPGATKQATTTGGGAGAVVSSTEMLSETFTPKHLPQEGMPLPQPAGHKPVLKLNLTPGQVRV